MCFLFLGIAPLHFIYQWHDATSSWCSENHWPIETNGNGPQVNDSGIEFNGINLSSDQNAALSNIITHKFQHVCVCVCVCACAHHSWVPSGLFSLYCDSRTPGFCTCQEGRSHTQTVWDDCLLQTHARMHTHARTHTQFWSSTFKYTDLLTSNISSFFCNLLRGLMKDPCWVLWKCIYTWRKITSTWVPFRLVLANGNPLASSSVDVLNWAFI